MKRLPILLTAAAMLVLVAAAARAQISPPPNTKLPPVPIDEIKKIAGSLRGNYRQLMKLRPTPAQIAQIAVTPDDAAKITAYVEKLFASVSEEGLIPSSPDQTDVIVNLDLPGGYNRIKGRLKPDVRIYGFKYVAPGQSIGMAYDGLIKVGDDWILIPKLWRAFSE